ncbi:MAG: maltokinase N-terminal cap-like domain-containing protein [Actinomycetota bacterium]
MTDRRDRLQAWLPDQRWFGGKERHVADITLVDEAVIDDGPPPLVLTVVEVAYEDGGRHLYHLPLIADEATVRDAFDEPERLQILGALMASGATIAARKGEIRFGGVGLDPLAAPGSTSVRAMGAEQTNTSVVLDEQVIVKLFRRVEIGPNPDLELTRLLTNEGFENVPAHVGQITYTGTPWGEEVDIDLGIAQQFIPESEEGWKVTLRALHKLYDEIHPDDAHEDLVFLTEERAVDILESIDELGDVTASMHVALSRAESGDPDFAAEPVEVADLKTWASNVEEALRRAGEDGSAGANQLTEAVEVILGRLLTISEAGAKMRIHGDYHLGQVLLTSRGWMAMDFEGEPARPLEERRTKQSPLRDVAGMLRSLSYAASAALFERAEPGSPDWERLQPWAETWESLARERFTSAYLRRSHEGRWLPADKESLATMLDVFEIDKVLYELRYEAGHRPEWMRIPLRGLEKILTRGS